MQPLQQLKQTPLPHPGLRLLTRIMLIDDDEIDQIVCNRVIKRAEITEDLLSYTSPSAALAYLADPDSPPIDLILLDVNMPRMNGFEFLEAAQKLITLPNVPPVFMMLSIPLGPLHRDHAKTFDVIKGYLDKPLSPVDLDLAVRSI